MYCCGDSQGRPTPELGPHPSRPESNLLRRAGEFALYEQIGAYFRAFESGEEEAAARRATSDAGAVP